MDNTSKLNTFLTQLRSSVTPLSTLMTEIEHFSFEELNVKFTSITLESGGHDFTALEPWKYDIKKDGHLEEALQKICAEKEFEVEKIEFINTQNRFDRIIIWLEE